MKNMSDKDLQRVIKAIEDKLARAYYPANMNHVAEEYLKNLREELIARNGQKE